MLKRTSLILALFLAACTSLPETPYEEALLSLEVRITYPEAYADYCREGVEVAIEEVSSAGRYTAPTDAGGCARAASIVSPSRTTPARRSSTA